MKRTEQTLIGLSAALLALGVAAGGSPPTSWPGKEALVEQYKGNVLILLVGHHTCPGTKKALPFLDNYQKRKPKDARIVYLELAMPNETGKPGEWKHPFPRLIDTQRKAAGELDFFFYPTLYVFDRAGRRRYTGQLRDKQFTKMVDEIVAEAPDAPLKLYNRPMPKPGDNAPAFTAVADGGRKIGLADLTGSGSALLVFSRISCSGTRAILPRISELKAVLEKNKILPAIVSRKEDSDDRNQYTKLCPGIPVLVDTDGKAAEAYGVDVSPIYFLIDAEGVVKARGPFTPEAVTAALTPKSPTKRPACSSGFG